MTTLLRSYNRLFATGAVSRSLFASPHTSGIPTRAAFASDRFSGLSRHFSDSNSVEAESDDDYDVMEEIADANERYKGKVVIKCTGSHGWGVYSERDWKNGDMILQGIPLETHHKFKDPHTIQYDVEKHATIDLPGRFINHVCGTANVGIQVVEKNQEDMTDKKFDGVHHDVLFEFYALEDIAEGDELQWDYETTEYDMVAKFDCLCGSPKCRTKLTGFHHHGDKVLEDYGEKWVAPYLMRMRKNEKDNQN